MQTVTKKLSELKRPNKNVRLHGDRQIKEYIRSIEMFGQIRPIVIDETNTILAGNGLFQALQIMGRETADCYVVGNLTVNQKKKLMLVDNKIFELGVNDSNVFDEILRELDGDIDIPGYDDELLRVLTANAKEADEIITSYGNFSEEKIQEMKTAQPLTPRLQQLPPQNDQQTEPTEQPQSVQRFVTCPKCGEKIWL
ncbi:MAG: ParB N-terminal domain-containing protein [Selenomonadaceae bacterium]|nr:ParB N-terminal domain-containing protein [Selenomonadaceae bacterium]